MLWHSAIRVRFQVSIRLRCRTVFLDFIPQKIVADQYADRVLGTAKGPGYRGVLSAAGKFHLNSEHKRPGVVPTWTCPHCGHVHRSEDIRCVDNDHLRCQGCGQIFDSKPDSGTTQGSIELSSRS